MFSKGFLKATEGPFAGLVFYPQDQEDAINRIHFRIFTWHGQESADDWEKGGWWHYDSILWDSEEVSIYTEVTCNGAELEAQYPWPELPDEENQLRWEELYDPEHAWKWVSAALSEPLGLVTLTSEDLKTTDPLFVEELEQQGVGKRLNATKAG